jgi:hypothetical protein
MKIITISKIGYNAPSQANWAYGIWKIDTIDTGQSYNMSYTVKETFGGDSRLRDILEKNNIKLIETKAVFPSQKITGIKSIQNMEDNIFITELIEWYNK